MLVKEKILGLVLNIHTFLFHEVRAIISPCIYSVSVNAVALALAQVLVLSKWEKKMLILKSIAVSYASLFLI